MKRNQVIVGIDIGTTNVKLVSLDLKGKILDIQKSRTLKYNKKDIDFFDIKHIYQFIEEILKQWSKTYKILGISASSVGESIVPISENGSYNDPIVWHSNATVKISDDFWEKHSNEKEKIYMVTGLIPTHIFSIFKIMMMQKYLGKIRSWLPISSFILYKLGAEPYWDYSQASRTMLFNIHTLEWDKYLLKISGISQKKLSNLASGGTCIGFWKNEGEKIPLFLGAHDHIAGMFAIEKISGTDDFIYDSMGTAESFTALMDKNIRFDRSYMEKKLNCGVYVDGKRLYFQRSIIISGGLISWLSSLTNFSGNWLSVSKRIEEGVFDIQVCYSSKGIYVNFHNIPYGASSEDFMASAIKFITKRSDEIVQDLRKVTKKGKFLFMSGGLTLNPVVKSIKASSSEEGKIGILKTPELTALGTALLAAKGLNIDVNLLWSDYINIE
ncbi:FGGY-family carbohydrate kinase [Mesoaciditoga lauensis]|uniref:FGGY-family carbohydrate kinase n=1 Tax=Mesoaciditoga lauensis TaxID=1495039 RepID=UPI0005663743|nr:FGGY family carbohydrate kinase [Mesoaciditoga lauensis]